MLPLIGMPGWESIALLATFISFLIVSLFYMFALALNLPGLKAWCKSEYMQVLASVLLIALIYLFVEVALGAASSFTFSAIVKSTTSDYIINPDSPTNEPIKDPTGQPIDIRNPNNPITTDHFNVAKLYLKRVMGCERDAYLKYYGLNSKIEFAEKFSVGNAGVEPVSGWPLSGAVSTLHYFTNTLTFAVFAQYIQLHLLDFAQSTMLTIFLPIGIVLRSFPLFRGAGGFLIATSLGFYLVFPLSLVMLTAVQNDINSECVVSPPGNLLEAEEGCNRAPSDAVMQVAAVQDFLDAGGGGWLEQQKAKIAVLVTQAMFFPIVAFVIAFTFIRGTSAMFGADLAEVGRGLIKLI